ncbi:hypothetical protein [Sphingobium sp. CAP-1]|uniref:hypothetical protein n=1 Tax=Sphingobium sp. CAP-1 TaxID=2676077 RepID=UPI001E63A403|nr:hypothetical protein [Sphingobium sp. CAP-1]
MSANALFAQWVTPARRRRFIDTMALALPLILALTIVSWLTISPLAAFFAAPVSLGVAFVIARQRAARFDRRWLIHSLDATRPELEDSSALLFSDDAPLSPLQSLQRHRVAARLDQGAPMDLAPSWSMRALLILSLFSVALIAAALLWPRAGGGPPTLSPAAKVCLQSRASPASSRRISASSRPPIPACRCAIPLRWTPAYRRDRGWNGRCASIRRPARHGY